MNNHDSASYSMTLNYPVENSQFSIDLLNALLGTSGTPSGLNRFVTDEDIRNSNNRPPEIHNNSFHSIPFLAASVFNNYIANWENSGAYNALAGTSGTPSNINRFVTNADSRNSDARQPLPHDNAFHTEAYLIASIFSDYVTNWQNSNAYKALTGSFGTPSDTNPYVTHLDPRVSAPTLQYNSAVLSAAVNLTNNNQFYDILSLNLNSGIWLINSHITQIRSATTAEHVTARITNKTTHYASQQMYHASVANTGVALFLTCIVSLSAQTSVFLQAATSSGAAASQIVAACPNNTSGNTATIMTAIRLSS